MRRIGAYLLIAALAASGTQLRAQQTPSETATVAVKAGRMLDVRTGKYLENVKFVMKGGEVVKGP